MTRFDQLGLKKDLLSVLSSLKFDKALPVQEKVIPAIMRGENTVFISQTGSGKTLVYVLGYLGKINKKLGLQMVILVPTRELAIQVGKEVKKICEPLYINSGVLYGGRPIGGDYKTLNKKNHILISTPGRIIQHINEVHIKVGDVKLLVFDESDQMFDQGFYKDCSYIRSRVSKHAQLVLASATTTEDVENFIEEEMGEYTFLRVGDLIPKNIMQEEMFVSIAEKNAAIVEFFKNKQFKRALVFCNTKLRCESVADTLSYHQMNAKVMSGSLEQQERINRLNLFKEGKIHVLVATDVAARGIHIPNVDIIVNYDVPQKAEFYVHRIGRTGRNDSKGYSLTMVCEEDEEKYELLKQKFELKTKTLPKPEVNI